MNLQNKTILVTGASGGIGEAISIHLAFLNAKLILVGRNLEKLIDLNRRLGDTHQIISTDLSHEKGRNDLFEYCQIIGKIDIIINVAGISEFSNFQDTNEKMLSRLININLISPILLTQKLLPLLAQVEKSIILYVGSTFGSIGFPGFTHYCASKFGLRGFSEALKRELADSNTKVLYIAPRATNTAINSVAVKQLNKNLGTKTDAPELVAKAVVKQLIKETDRVAIGWPERLFLKINGIFPSIIDSAISKQLQHIKKFI